MIAMACEAILFDLDGTLLDSAARIHRLWQWWAERHGLAFANLADIMHGRPAVETIRLAAPELEPEDEIDALETEEISDMHDMHLYPGALALLARLDGAAWAIVTSGSTRVAEARIRHVNLPRPTILITADEIRNGKPAPDCYLLAAERLGLRPEGCVVMEDAPVGVAAGKAAGMRVIAIASTHSPESLQAADVIVASLTDIHLETGARGSGILLQIPS